MEWIKKIKRPRLIVIWPIAVLISYFLFQMNNTCYLTQIRYQFENIAHNRHLIVLASSRLIEKEISILSQNTLKTLLLSSEIKSDENRIDILLKQKKQISPDDLQIFSTKLLNIIQDLIVNTSKENNIKVPAHDQMPKIMITNQTSEYIEDNYYRYIYIITLSFILSLLINFIWIKIKDNEKA